MAVAFLYTGQTGGPIKVTFSLIQLNLTDPSGYNITEAFEGKHLGIFKAPQNFSCTVNPTGVYVIKATKYPENKHLPSKALMYEQIHFKLSWTLYEKIIGKL